MSRLALSLLGPFQAVLEGQPVVGFRSDKARALLIFLAVEASRPHARETLAGLLWPDYPNATALTYLRSALANLRHLLDEPSKGLATSSSLFLLVNRETVQFNPVADARLDVVALTRLLEGHPTLGDLEQAVALCRGPFLEGFSIGACAAFDEWLLFKREQFSRLELSALHRLATAYIAKGQYAQAEACARRQLTLDPWDEPAHRQLMAVLAFDGRPGAALAQYEACRRVLAEELGVAPARETVDLRDRIQAGTLDEVLPQVKDAGGHRAPFVVRDRELAQLESHLTQALASNGGVVFVIGEAGSGKTTLMREFSRRAVASHRNAVGATGRCTASIGLGDPYLPFREVVQMLTGDIDVLRAGSAPVPEHVQRLWAVAPTAVRTLVESAPGLVDRFVAGDALALRTEAFAVADGLHTTAGARAALAARVRSQAERNKGATILEQSDLFEQVTAFLRALARHHPLILLLDDLQWADNGSISLLFHLGRSLAGSRILIVGAYRPEDIAQGRDGGRHPLSAVVHELQRDLGEIVLDLNQAAGRPFIDALLDSEPNRLGEVFRDTLYRRTEGHPLFAVELLQSLQEHGSLTRNDAGEWVEGQTLDWETLPARVEAIVAERIERLPAEVQMLLGAASVEGEEFSAEIVAHVQGLEERDLKARLSYALSSDYHLVRSRGLQRIEGRLFSRYRFRHHLFWQYLYNRLDEAERARLHEAVGAMLESLYAAAADHDTSRAPRLAWHFEQAGQIDKAVLYRRRAGDEAMRLAACEEAIAHYMHALALLATLPASAGRTEQEVALRFALAAPLSLTRGWAGLETRDVLARAYELAQAIDAGPQFVATLLALSAMYIAQGEIQKAVALGEELLQVAEQAEDPLSLAAAHVGIGAALFFQGVVQRARDHLEQAEALYAVQPSGPLGLPIGLDPEVSGLTWLALVVWEAGYPDQAAERSRAAIARARELGQPTTLAFALAIAGAWFHSLRREMEEVQACQETLRRIASDKGLIVFQVLGMPLEGRIRMWQGQADAGIAQIREATAAWQAMGTMAGQAMYLLLLIEAYRDAGDVAQAMATVEEALALIEQAGLRSSEAEVWRLKGELLASGAIPGEAEAEASFQHAIALARQQGARSWELRATVSLARLWRHRGRTEEARQILTDIYSWFTEGFDTPDLREARDLLQDLGCGEFA
ncbi:MAG: BTAD domain-containing putative transcriptional regulator [Anaerolineae bacterium]